MRLSDRFRLHDTCGAGLQGPARAVNRVGNFCEETVRHALRRNKRWLTNYDRQKRAAGSKALERHAHTLQQACQPYVPSRKQPKKWSLRSRVCNPKSPNYSFGWACAHKGHVGYRDGRVVSRGRYYRTWGCRNCKHGLTVSAGAVSRTSQGHGYLKLPTGVPVLRSKGTSTPGLDHGLKDLALCSTGEKIEHPRWYRAMQERRAITQPARKKRPIKKLPAHSEAQRSDFQHQLAVRLVRAHGAIFVGHSNAAGLAKTGMAKSILDAGWSQLRNRLESKAIRHPVVVFGEANEAISTQTCSDRSVVGGPKCRQGLAIRQWFCKCGASHDRDVNAANIIARRERVTLVEGACHG